MGLCPSVHTLPLPGVVPLASLLTLPSLQDNGSLQGKRTSSPTSPPQTELLALSFVSLLHDCELQGAKAKSL